MTVDRLRMLTSCAASVIVAAILAVLSACGSSGDESTAGPKAQITIALDPATASIAAGSSTTFTVRVTGTSGFTGPASISLSGAPSGVTAAVSPSQLAGSVTSSSVTVTASSSVAPGVYSLTVTGSGTGLASVTAVFALTVAAPLPTGDFSLTTNPATVSLVQGSATTASVALTRSGGFTGPIGLTVSGMSAGMLASFSPSNAPGASASLTISATSVATTGTVALTITGSADGLPSRSTSIQVTVTPAATGGSGDVAIDFTNCAPSVKPVWFAYQDGSGPWTRTTSAGDVYRFTITSAGGGYAYVSAADAAHSAVTVALLSRSELTTAPIVVCPTPFGNKTVNATVQAVGTGQDSFVSLGGSTIEASSGPASINAVPNGTYDLIGWRFNSARGLNTASDSRAAMVRDVNVGAGQSAGTIDFADPNAILPTVWTVNFEGVLAGDTFTGSMSYYTGPRDACVPALLYTFSGTTASVPAGTYGIPQSVQRASDFHVLSVTATNPPSTRTVQQSFHTAASVSALRLHDPIAAPTVVDVGSGGARRLQVTGSTPGIYSSALMFSYTDAVAARSATIQASVAALGGNAARLALPDFSAVTGWNPAWAPGTPTLNWSFGGSGATYSGLPCVEGATFYAAYYSGSM